MHDSKTNQLLLWRKQEKMKGREDRRRTEERERGRGETELETASEPSLQRLFLAPQPSPTEGPWCQGGLPKKEGPALREDSGPAPPSREELRHWAGAGRGPGLRAAPSPHLEHLDHVFAVALLSHVAQFGGDVNAATNVHIYLHGLLLDLGVQLRQVLSRERRAR